MINNIKIGSIYEHYSGKKYKIINLARFSEKPDQIFVIYQGLYDCPTFGKNPVWARPISMFSEDVIIEGQTKPRFREINL